MNLPILSWKQIPDHQTWIELNAGLKEFHISILVPTQKTIQRLDNYSQCNNTYRLCVETGGEKSGNQLF